MTSLLEPLVFGSIVTLVLRGGIEDPLSGEDRVWPAAAVQAIRPTGR